MHVPGNKRFMKSVSQFLRSGTELREYGRKINPAFAEAISGGLIAHGIVITHPVILVFSFPDFRPIWLRWSGTGFFH